MVDTAKDLSRNSTVFFFSNRDLKTSGRFSLMIHLSKSIAKLLQWTFFLLKPSF